MKKILRTLLILVVLTALGLEAAAAQETPAYWPTEGWLTTTPEEQGLKSEELAAYFSTWSQKQFHMDSLLVIRNGYLVAEAYAPLNGPDTVHNQYSVTKSVTGTLIGALIQDGLLESVDTPVVSLFPDRTIAQLDARKQALTVLDLLTMSSGLESNEMEAAQLGVTDTAEIMEGTPDWTQFALDRPMIHEPGAQWYYSNTAVQILSGIITQLTGKPADEYAAEKLFAPLGISSYRWNRSPNGEAFGASDLYLTPPDMAKLGYLYLNGGVWDGQQIIPADYAAAALGNQISTPWDGTNYGYLFWRIEPINLSFALGFGGQYIMVVPNSNMVVVMTAGMTEDLRVMLNGFPMFFATAGLTAGEALPANPAGTEALAAAIDSIQKPPALEAAPLPPLAAEISGKPYFLFNTNLLLGTNFVKRFARYNDLTEQMKVQTLTLTFDASDEALLTLGFVDNETLALPVGLDGIFRTTEGRLGTLGVKGQWLTDSLFRLEIKQGGTAVQYRLDINYIPGALNITSFEYTSGGAAAVLGIQMQ